MSAKNPEFQSFSSEDEGPVVPYRVLRRMLAARTGLPAEDIDKSMNFTRQFIIDKMRASEEAELPFLGVVKPVPGPDGGITPVFIPDAGLEEMVNQEFRESGIDLNPDARQLTDEEIIAIWNCEHPDTPLD